MHLFSRRRRIAAGCANAHRGRLTAHAETAIPHAPIHAVPTHRRRTHANAATPHAPVRSDPHRQTLRPAAAYQPASAAQQIRQTVLKAGVTRQAIEKTPPVQPCHHRHRLARRRGGAETGQRLRCACQVQRTRFLRQRHPARQPQFRLHEHAACRGKLVGSIGRRRHCRRTDHRTAVQPAGKLDSRRPVEAQAGRGLQCRQRRAASPGCGGATGMARAATPQDSPPPRSRSPRPPGVAARQLGRPAAGRAQQGAVGRASHSFSMRTRQSL